MSNDPTAEEVVETASNAAEGFVLSRYKQSDVRDLDVTATFEDGTLEVDVYLNVDDDAAEQVAEDAALTARAAVDDLFEDA